MGDANGRVSEAEGAGGGSMANDETQSGAFDVGFQAVEGGVTQDDRLGLGGEGLEQGVGSPLDGLTGSATQIQDPLTEGVDVALQVEFEVGFARVHGRKA
jgi:hypothetical protein